MIRFEFSLHFRWPFSYILSWPFTPGSGKTSLRSAISEETQGNVVIIDNDTFKQQHPNFDELVKLYEKDVVKHATSYSNQLVKLN
ncbi:zeta toxin family protein [Enterococcus avium]|uniref:UDP-N-acetylglucosamine kinase n=1 Tax=Enterococcus avium TaxID=33945 RepID=A0AAW8RZE7_ENTAV|nr:zeta toxin family protein [Enterococcus avium]MDB1724656.1 zeta toxin family protein [Enterococcus avium]MDT2404671.1 zeta toxin family protein [Enterococcus avium]